TVLSANLSGRVPTMRAGVTLSSGSFGGDPIEPGTLTFSMNGRIRYGIPSLTAGNLPFSEIQVVITVKDDAAGNLVIQSPAHIAGVSIGTVNSSTSAFTLAGSASGSERRYTVPK